ncbi:MAG TPA: class I SAM-dependent methyltransferase, partial [Micromonosporaceae bacterium]|nr:class I SAM-dependent methyltransferase [Micromonosporaceae bacterium]
MTDTDGPGRYRHLTFNAPLSDGRAESIVRRLVAAAPQAVVDVGCGWGELLLRIAERSPSTLGLGIDIDERNLRRGRDAARLRGLADRVNFENFSADEITQEADLVICIGSSHAFGDTMQALRSLMQMVRPGGRLLFGDGLWDPSATTDRSLVWDDMLELPDLAGLVEAAVAIGYRPLFVETST